jgi:hypothetical protein
VPSTGVKYPASTGGGFIDNVTGENDDAWVNPGNVGADDATEAQITAATFDSPDISRRLHCWNFDFSAIPDGSSIDGITVEIDRRSIVSGSGADFRVQLSTDAANITTGPTLTGDNKANTGLTWPTTSTVATYGGSADTWNASLTAAQVKTSTFGVLLSASAKIANADIGCDFIRVAITYTAPAAQTAQYGVAVETDSALVFVATKQASYGIAAETDTALSFIRNRDLLYGVAVETDTALAFGGQLGGGPQEAFYGVAAETDAALTFTHSKQAPYGIAAEGDIGLAFVAAKTASYGIAAEVDAALAFGTSKAAAYSVAAEIDSALAFTHSKVARYGTAGEVDSALAWTGQAAGAQQVVYGPALETDVALSFLTQKLAAYGVATEVDGALSFLGSKFLQYGIASETDVALVFVTVGGIPGVKIFVTDGDAATASGLEGRAAVLSGIEAG